VIKKRTSIQDCLQKATESRCFQGETLRAYQGEGKGTRESRKWRSCRGKISDYRRERGRKEGPWVDKEIKRKERALLPGSATLSSKEKCRIGKGGVQEAQ